MDLCICFWEQSTLHHLFEPFLCVCTIYVCVQASGLWIGECCVPLFCVLLFTLTDAEKRRTHRRVHTNTHTHTHMQTVKE